MLLQGRCPTKLVVSPAMFNLDGGTRFSRVEDSAVNKPRYRRRPDHSVSQPRSRTVYSGRQLTDEACRNMQPAEFRAYHELALGPDEVSTD